MTPDEAGAILPDDYVYLLAPPDRARLLDRLFAERPTRVADDSEFFGDFVIDGEAFTGAVAGFYGETLPDDVARRSVAEHFADHLGHPPEEGEALPLGAIALVAYKVTDGNVTTVGLRLADGDTDAAGAAGLFGRAKRALRSLIQRLYL